MGPDYTYCRKCGEKVPYDEAVEPPPFYCRECHDTETCKLTSYRGSESGACSCSSPKNCYFKNPNPARLRKDMGLKPTPSKEFLTWIAAAHTVCPYCNADAGELCNKYQGQGFEAVHSKRLTLAIEAYKTVSPFVIEEWQDEYFHETAKEPGWPPSKKKLPMKRTSKWD